METNLEKAKRLMKDNAAIIGIDLPKDGFIFKMLELTATPNEPSEYIGQSERLSLIIDKYFPAEGVGTEREKARMELFNEIAKLLPSTPTYYPYDAEMFQELFEYMYDNHHVTLLESEMDEIMNICLRVIGGKENDVNKELLKACKDSLEKFINMGKTNENYYVMTLREVIKHAEKQIKA